MSSWWCVFYWSNRIWAGEVPKVDDVVSRHWSELGHCRRHCSFRELENRLIVVRYNCHYDVRAISCMALCQWPYLSCLQVLFRVETNPWARNQHQQTCTIISAICAATRAFTSKHWTAITAFIRASGHISASCAPGRLHRSATWSCIYGGTVLVPTGATSATESSGMASCCTSTCDRNTRRRASEGLLSSACESFLVYFLMAHLGLIAIVAWLMWMKNSTWHKTASSLSLSPYV